MADEHGDTAIWWTENLKRDKVRRTGTERGYTWVETAGGLLICSCYFSPNRDHHDFTNYLTKIGEHLRQNSTLGYVVVGDFNAASTLWGSLTTSQRGEELEMWTAEHDLVFANDGQAPTFRRKDQEAFIDTTISSPAYLVSEWQVNEESDSMSDHQYIEFLIETHNEREKDETQQVSWKARDLDRPLFIKTIDEKCKEIVEKYIPVTVDIIADILTSACMSAAPSTRSGHGGKKPMYWWTKEIGDLRKNCNKHRRKYVRLRRRPEKDVIERVYEEYSEVRKLYRNKIRESKRAKWRELCELIKEDVWGLPYKIVRNKFGQKRLAIPRQTVDETVEELFPKGLFFDRHDLIQRDEDEVTEVLVAAERMAANKAPGPDGIPPEATKTLMSRWPRLFCKLVDGIWESEVFPGTWKTARLTLIPKAGKKNAFRPICLLNTVAKGVETIINRRLQAELEEKDGLSDRQFGFRHGRSTLSAIEVVTTRVKQEMSYYRERRRMGILVLLDVKNAFNSI